MAAENDTAGDSAMRVMAIDFGEKRVGIALSASMETADLADPGAALALPSRTIERTTDRRLVYTLAALAREEEVGVLVLGEPRDLEGRAGEAAERVRRFAAKLEKASGLPVHLVEETLTTVAAAERLGGPARKGKGGPADGRHDAVAAQILLQEALDRGLAGR